MKTKPATLRIAFKYCGGCNPDYDRVSVAEAIRSRLADEVEFSAAGERDDIDIVLVLTGCETACIELGAWDNREIIEIRSGAEAEKAIAAIRQRLSAGSSRAGCKTHPADRNRQGIR